MGSLKTWEKRRRKWKIRRNKKKRPRVRLSLVRPQGQALEAVGVDALDGHVDVGVVVHPKPIFSTPRNHVLFVFFAAQEKRKICASPISNTIHGFMNIYR